MKQTFISQAHRSKPSAFSRGMIPILITLFSHTVGAVETGTVMPECALSALGAGQDGKLSQYQGKVLYVDFWASWCGPCAKSFPFMNQLHRDLANKGLQVVGVNLDENLDDAKTFLNQYPAEFTIVADVSKQCAKDFDVKAMPSSYLVDKQGKVHHIHLGFKPGEAEELRSKVESLLGG